jgi:transcriptional regulator with XRE-family HTH domain
MKKKYSKIIAKNLNRLMAAHNKRQIDLCNDLDISRSTMNTWVTGEKTPRFEKLEILANYFDVEVTDLLIDSDESTPYDCPVNYGKLSSKDKTIIDAMINILLEADKQVTN